MNLVDSILRSLSMNWKILVKIFYSFILLLKPDLQTPTLSADFWNSRSKLSKKSPQCNDFSDFEKSVNWLQFLARFLLEFCLKFWDFESADKIGGVWIMLKTSTITTKNCTNIIVKNYYETQNKSSDLKGLPFWHPLEIDPTTRFWYWPKVVDSLRQPCIENRRIFRSEKKKLMNTLWRNGAFCKLNLKE